MYKRQAGGLERLRRLTNGELLAVMDAVAGEGVINWMPVPCTGSYIGEWFNAGFREESLSIPVIAGSVFTELVPRPKEINEKNALSEQERYTAVVQAFGLSLIHILPYLIVLRTHIVKIPYVHILRTSAINSLC